MGTVFSRVEWPIFLMIRFIVVSIVLTLVSRVELPGIA